MRAIDAGNTTEKRFQGIYQSVSAEEIAGIPVTMKRHNRMRVVLRAVILWDAVHCAAE
jgi:hypothetical protein